MATISFEDGTHSGSMDHISAALAPLNVTLEHWPVVPEAVQLLNKAALSDAEKSAVLAAFDESFKRLQSEAGYQSCDLIVLHNQIEGLDALLSKFERTHTHDDDEVRYIIDGEGVFGFTRPDGSQVELLVQAGDYINVPRETEHWFYLTSSKRIKAIRYFTTMDGWAPNYTDREIRMRRQG